MSLTLRIVMIVFSLLFLLVVFRLVAKGRLQIKYSLMWMVLTLVLIICSIFPQIIFFFARILGFNTASNFVFVVGMFMMMAIMLSLSMIVSWQSQYIRSLVQTVALLRKDLEEKKPDAEA
jgi:hypothetical protein